MQDIRPVEVLGVGTGTVRGTSEKALVITVRQNLPSYCTTDMVLSVDQAERLLGDLKNVLPKLRAKVLAQGSPLGHLLPNKDD